MKGSILIGLGILAGLSSAPVFAASQSPAAAGGTNNRQQAASAKKEAVAACKKEGNVGKKLDACVKEKLAQNKTT